MALSATPKLPPLVPSFKNGLYRCDDSDIEEANTAFRETRPLVLVRDRYRCVACGVALRTPSEEELKDKYCSAYGIEVHHIDGDHHNNHMSNLVSLCRLCHSVLHIGFAVETNLKDCMRIIWMPSLTQEELDLLSWTLAVAIYRGEQNGDEDVTELVGNAKNIAALLRRQPFPDDFLGNSNAMKAFRETVLCTPDPQKIHPVRAFARILSRIRSIDVKAYDRRASWLQGLRIFFDPVAHASFADSGGKQYVPAIADAGDWCTGTDWVGMWKAISRQFKENN